MLAVGEIPKDAIHRITRGDTYTCCMGSESEHQRLSEFCQALQDLLASTGQQLSDYSPDELRDLLSQLTREGEAGA
ncbi:MAG: hypothetical protein ACO3N7_00155 [Kiritimatiellia bacterium]